ncbi:MAG: hypothetical protein VX815_01330, partial [Gemmatimonadota bacterium]|nr:hypothetical protein [Gemmatimonadota bacterium]
MRLPARNQAPRKGRFSSANERWKAQWSVRLALSTLMAVAAHAVLFVLGPTWRVSFITPDLLPSQPVRLVWVPE